MEKVKLGKRCFKLEKSNAKAMINGFEKEGKIIHQAIYCGVSEGENYRLIILQRCKNKNYKLSPIGESFNSDSFSIPKKYIAELIKTYGIEDVVENLEFWKEVCSNGLFDIWDHIRGPHERYTNPNICQSNKSNFVIQLFRIWEIGKVLQTYESGHNGRFEDLIEEDIVIDLIKPVIDNEEFQKIKELLEKTLEEYKQGKGLKMGGDRRN